MSVWLCIPSKRPPEEAEPVLKLWRERGYKIALWLDIGGRIPQCDYFYRGESYPGYAIAVNRLIQAIVTPCEADGCDHESCHDPQADWFVTGGDDIEPDRNHSAEEIARQCSEHFMNHWLSHARFEQAEQIFKVPQQPSVLGTFGVMQPTGDRWGDKQGAYIDRVCGSPWIGREFARRINQGRGPLWPEYFHMGEDEELQAVALKLGVLWQRPDLIHLHRHWGRANQLRSDMPKFLERANSAEEWARYKELFRTRQAAGFPGSEPLP